MKAWVRKDGTVEGRPAGPLKGIALKRMQESSTPTLMEWVENSLSKIGILLVECQRDRTNSALIEEAKVEAAAMMQALEELTARLAAQE